MEKEIYLNSAIRFMDTCGNSYSNKFCELRLAFINRKLGTDYPVIGKILEIRPIWVEALDDLYEQQHQNERKDLGLD